MNSNTKARVGRPRSERARLAVLNATLEMVRESGPEALTMEAIAKRAQVSKETVYRWWRSKTEVVLEALTHYGEDAIPIPDSGSFEGDLRLFMRGTSKALDLPTRRLLRSLAAGAATQTAMADMVRERFLSRRRAALAAVLAHPSRRGELTPERAECILDMVFGSLWYRLIFGTGPLDEAWADTVTDAIIHLA